MISVNKSSIFKPKDTNTASILLKELDEENSIELTLNYIKI